MFELLNRGGFVMYFILASSIVALAIAIERTIYYRLTRSRNKKLMSELEILINNDKLSEAVDKTTHTRSAIGRITCTYLKNISRSKDLLEESVNASSQYEIMKLEKHLPVLSAVSNLAPLMGLLGTVIGMIYVFRDIAAQGGQADINILAGGIWQALLTTAFGLTVAIPVTGFYHYFQNLVNERIGGIERRISELNVIFGISCCDENSHSKDAASETNSSDGFVNVQRFADETVS